MVYTVPVQRGGQTNMFKLAKVAIFAATVVILAGPAFADIKAYNEAVKAGDYKAAAAEAASIWATFDKTSPDTAAVAREFGFSSYVAGDFSAAHNYGKFLKDNGGTLPKPDDQPAVSSVLLAAADYRLNPKSGRDNLLDALNARTKLPGLDNITLLAAEALYHGDWNDAAWQQAARSADLAASLFDRGGASLRPRYYHAQVTAAAAQFLASPSQRDYDAMAEVHDAIVGDINGAKEQQTREALGREMYQARTWLTAMHTFIHSFSNQTGSLISHEVKERRLESPKRAIFQGMQDRRPLCEGRLDLGNFNYPSSALFRGIPGAVTLRLALDDSGAVTNAEVLGSVPSEIFADALVNSTSKFRWRAKEGQNLKACRVQRENFIFMVEFLVG